MWVRWNPRGAKKTVSSVGKMRDFHHGDALSLSLTQRSSKQDDTRVKVRVLVRSGWTLGTLGKPGSHPPETGGSWPSSPVKAWVCSGLACLNGCQQ